MEKKTALKILRLTVKYERAPALCDLSFEVPQGKLVAIVGPNGAGKSTLIKTALGLIKPSAGEIEFFNSSLKKERQKIAYVPQKERVDWDFPITVFDLVLMGRYGHIGLFRWPSKKDKELAWHYLEQVGLTPFAKRQISELSGGEQQRAFIARSLCQEADLYFMDEPFAGIDIISSQMILDVLLKLKEEGKTLFVVHHDLASVAKAFDWAILLNKRLIACGEVREIFTKEMIEQAYGRVI